MVKFGTDGWRAVIGREFTYENVRRVASAHADLLKEKGISKVVVGYDWRFSSEHFAREVCAVFRALGLDVCLSKEACTTPMVSYGVKYMGFGNGVMITASHNPPEYNGYKIKDSFGGSATPSFVREVENRIPESAQAVEFEGAEPVDLRTKYKDSLRSWVNLELFAERESLLVHDAMHGTSSGLLSEVLSGTKVQVLPLRSFRDPLFGGRSPEPVEKNLSLLKDKVRSMSADLGVANDGDGDRIALVDERGNFVNTQLIYVLLLLHLLKNKGMREGVVVKTVSTTYLADRICKAFGIELREVPVGFKNINEVILREKVLFGGEESGGYGVPVYLPERDGTLSALFILEGLYLLDKPLSGVIEEIFKEFGEAHYKRVDFPADDRTKGRLKELVSNPPDRLGGRVVSVANVIDGLKLVFENDSWLLFRASGTEPLIRVYAEAPSVDELDSLIEAGVFLLSV